MPGFFCLYLKRRKGVPEVSTQRLCNAPLNSCSRVKIPEEDTGKGSDGRRHHALDLTAQVGTGP